MSRKVATRTGRLTATAAFNATSQRRMAVLDTIKLVITNWPTNADGTAQVEHFELTNNPENPDDGMREVAFSGELYIEDEDFAETFTEFVLRDRPSIRSGPWAEKLLFMWEEPGYPEARERIRTWYSPVLDVPATIEGGAVVQVPLFVNQGDMIRVDTGSGQYVSRV